MLQTDLNGAVKKTANVYYSEYFREKVYHYINLKTWDIVKWWANSNSNDVESSYKNVGYMLQQNSEDRFTFFSLGSRVNIKPDSNGLWVEVSENYENNNGYHIVNNSYSLKSSPFEDMRVIRNYHPVILFNEMG